MLAERVQLVPMQRGSSVLQTGSPATRTESLAYFAPGDTNVFEGPITFVFGLYFALVEISERMGRGELWTLLFECPKSPKTASGSSQQATVIVGNVR
jgi:hypothetical protein